jgi:hypothetical protein
MMSREQEEAAKRSLDQVFETCASIMRRRKKYRITPDFLAEEVSDHLRIPEPDLFVEPASEWLAKQDWFIPDVDGGFWTK